MVNIFCHFYGGFTFVKFRLIGHLSSHKKLQVPTFRSAHSPTSADVCGADCERSIKPEISEAGAPSLY